MLGAAASDWAIGVRTSSAVSGKTRQTRPERIGLVSPPNAAVSWRVLVSPWTGTATTGGMAGRALGAVRGGGTEGAGESCATAIDTAPTTHAAATAPDKRRMLADHRRGLRLGVLADQGGRGCKKIVER
jgi:hypothetical protein